MVVSRLVLLAGALAGIPAHAQSVEIYSEFQRVDPFGRIVFADRASVPREILSPAVARNSHACFHVAVSVPPRDSYLLYVVTNPVDACRVSVYKEHFVKTGEGWIPDVLSELRRLPDFGVVPDPDDGIDAQTTRLYLLDLWIPPDAGVGRFRVEVQVKAANWTVTPMEVRVTGARVPDLAGAAPPGNSKDLPPVGQGADAAVWGPIAEYLSGKLSPAQAQPLTVRGVIRRDAIQDMALAGSLDPAVAGPEAMRKRLADLLRLNYEYFPRLLGAEWYLRIRDFLYQ